MPPAAGRRPKSRPLRKSARDRLLLRARLLLPISGPPVENALIEITAGKITALGPASPGHGAQDLGDTLVLPGLINAHCHLDYTGVAGKIPPTKSFGAWIKTLLAIKSEWGRSDYQRSWAEGAAMLLRTGTTTVGDIEVVPELLPAAWDTTPLRVFSFLEMTGVRSGRPPAQILGQALAQLAALGDATHPAGLSPHALYSTTPALLKLAAAAARKKNLRIATHVAESDEEFDMYLHGRGPLFDWLHSQRDCSDCGQRSPVQQLERLGLLSSRFLAIHVNYLGPGDAALLARRGAHVVHCPRSHAYFRHQPFPFSELKRAGVNVALGTDSLASINRPRHRPTELNMFSEMQCFAARNPGVPARAILQMATLQGARALGMKGQLGEIIPGAAADLIGIPFSGKKRDAIEAAVHHSGDVSSSMIAGRWAIPHPK